MPPHTAPDGIPLIEPGIEGSAVIVRQEVTDLCQQQKQCAGQRAQHLRERARTSSAKCTHERQRQRERECRNDQRDAGDYRIHQYQVPFALQQATAATTLDAAVIDYAVRIVAATRGWPGIALGAGPRGSLALVRAARARAVLSGRDFVTPDDVREIALPALRHRIALAPELQIEGQDADRVLLALLARVEAPRR